MSLLLRDLVWRWKWLLVIEFLGSLSVTVAVLALTSNDRSFDGLLFLPLAYLLVISYADRTSGWNRVVRTMPVHRRDVADALWCWHAFAFAGVFCLGVLVALPFQALFTEPFAIRLADVALIAFVALVLTTAVCLIVESIAESTTRLVADPRRWLGGLHAMAPLVHPVLGIAVGAVVLKHLPLRWDLIDVAFKLAATVGLLVVALSFLRRQWLLHDLSQNMRPREAREVSKHEPVAFTSRTWADIRPYVVSATVVTTGLWTVGLFDAAFVALGLYRGSFMSSLLGGEAPGLVGVYLVMGAPLASSYLFPLRPYRALPVSSTGILLRVTVHHATVYFAFLVAVAPYLLLPNVNVTALISVLWCSFGFSLMLFATSAITSKWASALIAPSACIWGPIAFLLDALPTALSVALGAIVTSLGLLGVRAVITRSSRAYRMHSALWDQFLK